MRRVNEYDDATAHEILRRAIEIHTSRTDRYSDTELKAVALELGVTPDIIEQAIEEYEHSRTHTSSGIQEVGASLAVPVLAGLVGIFSSMLANGRNGHGILVFWISVVTIVAAALLSKGKRRHLVFQISNAAYWIVVALHTMLVNPQMADDLMVPVLAFLLTFGVVGGLIVERQRQAEARKFHGGGSSGSRTGSVSGVRKLIDRLRRFAGLNVLAVRVLDGTAEWRTRA